MTEEKDTVTGKVVSVTPWKSGKGAWVNLEGNPNDFFAYSGKVPGEGSTGTWEVEPGQKHLSDKVCLAKRLDKDPEKTTPAEKPEPKKTDMEELINKGDNVYFERQNLIVRQTCMKAAARIVAAMIARGDKIATIGAMENAADIADKLYDWVVGNEEKLPEPPEEP